MSKQTRQQKREEEQKILAEMDEAMKTTGSEEKPKKGLAALLEDKTPERLHCRRCNTYMEEGVCPSCGFRAYVPMDKKLQSRIRMILGGVCLVVFAVLFFWLQMK